MSEQAKHREAMERMTSQLVRSGVPEQRAREEARKRAVEADRQERDKR